SLKKAIKISSELVQEAKKNNDVDRLYDEVISNFDSIPALMKGSMVENLMDHYATTFDDEKMSVLSSIIKKDIAGLGGRLAKGLDTGRGEVAKTVKDILGDHAQEKTEKMGRDTEKKIKKLHNEIKANKEEIDQ